MIGPGQSSMVRGIRRGLRALAIAVLGVSALAAQNAQPTNDDNVVTLHVYPDLVQIPTLVLGKNHQAIPPIAENRFFVSINGGPKFRVTHARLERDDPISLAILLDPSESEADLMSSIDDAIAGLAPLSLTATDHLSIYALDCQLFRSSVSNPADPAAVEHAVDSVLQSWNARPGAQQSASCPNPRYLWDTVAVLTKELSERSGLRVMLVVSGGHDGGSRNDWNLVRLYAQRNSVAIFGITSAQNSTFARSNVRAENAFNSVCQLSGGMLLTVSPNNLAKQMQWFMQMVRGRYIVEFPHPVTTKPSHLNMDITIARSHAFIRPAGAAVSVDDPKILNDPMTVRPDASYAPQVGNRTVLTPH